MYNRIHNYLKHYDSLHDNQPGKWKKVHWKRCEKQP